MFRSRKPEFDVDWEHPPWWRVLSLRGWGLLFLAAFATMSFVFGLFSGETLLAFSYKQKSGPLEAAFRESPFLFLILMAGNLAMSVVLWVLFFSWMGDRRRALRKPPVSPLISNHEAKKHEV